MPVATKRPNIRPARSLHSDQAQAIVPLGRYVTTELWLELGRYVATEGSDVRSLRSDRHRLGIGCYVAPGQRVCAVVTQRPSLVRLLLNLQGYFLVKTSYWLSFFLQKLYLYFYYLFRKYDLRGFLGGNSVVTVFDPKS